MLSPLTVKIAAIGLTAFAAAVLLTPLVRALARRIGAVAAPKSDRWHQKPTAMMGGVAIYLAVAATTLLFLPRTRESWIVFVTSTFLFAIGLIDDFLRIKPYQKLIGQLVGAGTIVYFGFVLPWTSSAPLNMAVTFLWIVGITNAVNMLDNMDGLAAGICAVAAGFLAINFVSNHQPAEALTLAAFAGGLLGFLIYNHNPASIFMGDCGSMFVGFFLASTALLARSGSGRSKSVVAVLAVPVLVLCVPIFDTTFVTLMRKMAGRAASQGGRDHTSHRLVALGLSERHAVWMLYALAISAGLLALVVRHAPLDVSVATIGSFVVLLTFLGIHLARVRVYEDAELAAARERPLVSFLVGLTYKRRIFEVALDAVLVSLSYYLAFALKFGPMTSTSSDWQLFVKTMPIVVCVKLATLLAAGVYRGIWRYASLANVIDFARAVALSSVLAVLTIVFAFRFEGFSRTVVALDAILLLVMLSGSRFAFRVLRRLFPMPHQRTGKRVLIYGAGDGGELIFRELQNNPALGAVPVGFVDDDPGKAGRLIHGLRVYSPITPLIDVCRRLNVEEVLISTNKIGGDRLTLIVGECAAAGLRITRAHMAFQPLSPADFGWVMSSETPAPAPLISRQGDTILHPAVHTAATDH